MSDDKNNNVNQANNQNINEEIVFKIKLKSLKLLAYGLIFFSVIRKTKECGFKQVIASLKPNLYQDLVIELNWELLKEKLFDFTIKKADTVNQPITEDIMSVITEALKEPDFREDMLTYADKEQFGSIYELLKNKLSDVIPGRIELQCEIEKIDSTKSFEKQASEEEAAKKNENAMIVDPKSPHFINVEGFEDKLLGKKIGNLKSNDKIILKITDNSFSEKVYENLPSFKFGHHYGTFTEFYKDDSGINYAVFNLGNNFFGRFKVAKEDNIKKIKYVMPQNESGLDKLKFITDNTFTFYIILITVAVILCFLSWQYYTWLYE
ncbi:hypothetical protein KA977_06275 [Candidatus Dependentiae bacterium]|nr:hypothetical protein [Candidatus Dependentiae bacterium]